MGKHGKNKNKKHSTWSDDFSEDLGSVGKDYNRAQAKKSWQDELETALDEDANGLGESQESNSH